MEVARSSGRFRKVAEGSRAWPGATYALLPLGIPPMLVIFFCELTRVAV